MSECIKYSEFYYSRIWDASDIEQPPSSYIGGWQDDVSLCLHSILFIRGKHVSCGYQDKWLWRRTPIRPKNFDYNLPRFQLRKLDILPMLPNNSMEFPRNLAFLSEKRPISACFPTENKKFISNISFSSGRNWKWTIIFQLSQTENET